VLGQRVRQLQVDDPNRDLTQRDLQALGYGEDMARRILALLDETELLEHYCMRSIKADCTYLSRICAAYPEVLRKKLGDDSPGVLWAKGDLSLLNLPKIGLVGSRELLPENREFAKEVGRQAALQGYVLVSGNARGADKAAQDACLAAGGQVISVVADKLESHSIRPNVLYLSEDGFDCEFSAQRAISRNRVIHALGGKTFVAQCGYQTGGTWDGSVKNLRFGWSAVYCFEDGSPAQDLLVEMGANAVTMEELSNISNLKNRNISLF
jgi:DNA processing protein